MSYRFAGGGPRSSSCTSSPVAGAAPGRASLGGFSPSPDDCRPSTRGPKGASLALGTAGLSWLCDRWFLRTASPGGADAPWSQRRRPLLLGLRIGESADALRERRAVALPSTSGLDVGALAVGAARRRSGSSLSGRSWLARSFGKMGSMRWSSSLLVLLLACEGASTASAGSTGW